MYQRSISVGKYPHANYFPVIPRKIGSSFSTTREGNAAEKMSTNFSTTREGNAAGKKSNVIEFHSSSKWKIHFEASKDSNKLMVIDFTASWCGPCRYMEPVLNDLAAKYPNVEFIKIDVDELPDVAEIYKVQTLPALILIKKGTQVDKIVGVKKEELQMKIEKHKV